MEFHQAELIPRKKSGFGSKAITKPKLSEYYDYFETIITSVIFAYTAVEAFANICIPFNFTYDCLDKEKNTVKLNKSQIELKLSLDIKLKEILPEIIGCKSPNKETWWTNFKELEDLRNEIIHSKESKSENRYSKLLSAKIEAKILSHRQLIEYFGKAISQSKPELLDKFPNGFGQDYYHIKTRKHSDFEKDSKLLGL